MGGCAPCFNKFLEGPFFSSFLPIPPRATDRPESSIFVIFSSSNEKDLKLMFNETDGLFVWIVSAGLDSSSSNSIFKL